MKRTRNSSNLCRRSKPTSSSQKEDTLDTIDTKQAVGQGIKRYERINRIGQVCYEQLNSSEALEKREIPLSSCSEISLKLKLHYSVCSRARMGLYIAPKI